MINQSPETIIYEGVEYNHRCYILEQVKPKIEFHPTGNFYLRGFHGAWEIRDNKLYFVDLIVWRHETNSRLIVPQIRVDEEAELYMGKREGFDLQELVLQDVFPGAPADGVFADWFNGELAIPPGVPMKKGSIAISWFLILLKV
ncbi:hypothetical protein ICN30_01520 [Polynucleobacter sp. 31A-FELB]|uniref:hypothetical protein n=1 Tax=Polynucleobacter sp. 31A-FELB TaxID=2689096 RepID=UPI001C0DC675|nr:hypothetical protein [Polynucleobacter sp. 31A-FELB]MBU3586509.1 hypothetical protein [Polynucleobacter sp. 31A-FELB]